MRQIIVISILIGWSFGVSGKVLPDNFKRVGQTTLSVLWIDVYTAELFTGDGDYTNDTLSVVIELSYHQNISQNSLLKETGNQIKEFARDAQIDEWLDSLAAIWPDIKEGDRLAFWKDKSGLGHFFLKDRWIGSLEDPEFSTAFLKIWLSEKSSYPQLAKQLRGESSEDDVN